MYIYVYIFMYIYICVCIYVYVCVYIYIRMHIYICIMIMSCCELSHHPSLSPISPGRSSKLYPVSAQSCYISVLAGRPCEAVHIYIYISISLMRPSLFLQQYPACLVCLTRIVFVMGGSVAVQSLFCGMWASRTCSVLKATFLGKVGIHPSVHLSIAFLVIYGITVSEQSVVEFPGLSYFWGYFMKLYSF